MKDLRFLLDHETTCQECGKSASITWKDEPIEGPAGPIFIGTSTCQCGAMSLQVEGPRQPRWVYEQLLHLVTGEEVTLDLNPGKETKHGNRTSH